MAHPSGDLPTPGSSAPRGWCNDGGKRSNSPGLGWRKPLQQRLLLFHLKNKRGRDAGRNAVKRMRGDLRVSTA
eukprot:11166356-Lingulodinium_polyedra.AAC.1